MARWNRTGSAAVTNGSAAVTGTLTAWLASAKAGDRVTFDAGATWYEVAEVTSNTALTLGSAFAGSTGTYTGASGAFAIDASSRSWFSYAELHAAAALLIERIALYYPQILGGDATKLARVNSSATGIEYFAAQILPALAAAAADANKFPQVNGAGNGFVYTAGSLTPPLAGAGADALKFMRANSGGTALEYVLGILAPTLAGGGADGLKFLRANSGGTALEYVVGLLAPSLAGAGADALKFMRANSGGTALEYVTGILAPALAGAGADGGKIVAVNTGGTALEYRSGRILPSLAAAAADAGKLVRVNDAGDGYTYQNGLWLPALAAAAADARKIVRVNAAGTGIEYVSGHVPPSGVAGNELQYLRLNAARDGLEYATPAGGGGGAGINASLVVNGDFQINQRRFAGGALTAGLYGFDRWKADTGGANLSVSGYVVTLTSGAIVQPIEPALWGYASLAGQQITVSVEAPSADLTITLGSVSGTITAGSNRRSVTLTTAGGDTGNLSLKIARATAGTVTFSRVKAEMGASATDWQPRTLSVEQHIARRYCQPLFQGNNSSGSVIVPFYFQLVASIVIDGLYAPNPVMRAAPTLLTPQGSPTYQASNPASGNTYGFYNNTGGGFASPTGGVTLSLNGAAANGVGVRMQASSFTSTSGGVGNVYAGPTCNVLAEAEI